MTAVQDHCEIFHADDEDYFSTRCRTGRRRARSAATAAERSAWTTPSGSRPGPSSRAEPTAVSTSCTAGPACSSRCCSRGRSAGWSSPTSARCVLFVAAFWQLDTFSRRGRHGLQRSQNFQTLIESDVYRTIVLRTVADRRRGDGHRRAPGVPDGVLHRQGRRRRARALLVVAVLMPLWRLPRQGLRVAVDPRRGRDPQLGARPVRARRARASATSPVLVLSLPLAAVHDPADLRRARAAPRLAARRVRRPRRRPGQTFRRVILPLACRRSPPARSSRSRCRSATTSRRSSSRSTQFIGNVIYENVCVANNLPLAAAFTTVPLRDHGRLPARRAAARRLRDALMHLSPHHARAAADRRPGSRSRSSTCRCAVIALYAFNERRR